MGCKRFLDEGKIVDVKVGVLEQSFMFGWKTSDAGIREYFAMDYTGERVKILCYKNGSFDIAVRDRSYVHYNETLLSELIKVFREYLLDEGCKLCLATA